jgi:Flp pilus assembly protein TadD
MSTPKKRQNTNPHTKPNAAKSSANPTIPSNVESTPNTPWYDNTRLGATLVAILAFVLYSNTLAHDFAMDDSLVLTGNKYVQRGAAGISDIFNNSYLEGFSGIREATYRPFSLSVFALEKDFLGGSASTYHLMNVLWYVATCVVVFAFLKSLLNQRGLGWLSLLLAMLFTAHPIHTEVVANIKSRDEILACFGMALCLLSLLKNAEKWHWTWLGVACVGAWIAFFSKESALVLILLAPLVLWFRGGVSNKRILSLSAFILPIALWFLSKRQSIIGQAPLLMTKYDNSLAELPLDQRYATAFDIVGRYLKLLFWPQTLSADYSFNQIPASTWASPGAWVSLVLVGLTLGLAVWAWRERSLFSLGVFFFVISFGVTSNFVVLIGSTMAERFMFTPLLGFLLALGGLFLLLQKYFQISIGVFVYGFLPLSLLLMGLRTTQRNGEWKNDDTMFLSMAKTAPNSARVQSMMGRYWRKKADETTETASKQSFLDSSAFYFKKGLGIYDRDHIIWYQLASTEKAAKRFDQASEALKKAITLDSNIHQYYFQLGYCLGEAQRYPEAIAAYRKVEQMKPNEPSLNGNLAYVLRHGGQPAEAVKYYEKILISKPNDVQTLNDLVRVYRDQLNNIPKALEYNERLRLAKGGK